MIQNMVELLNRLKLQRPDVKPKDSVMLVRECQKAMDRAAKIVGIPRITHHDLRHLFATRCIESAVDIPTVSRWLGHKDGGALLESRAEACLTVTQAYDVFCRLAQQHQLSPLKRSLFRENMRDLVRERYGVALRNACQTRKIVISRLGEGWQWWKLRL